MTRSRLVSNRPLRSNSPPLTTYLLTWRHTAADGRVSQYCLTASRLISYCLLVFLVSRLPNRITRKICAIH
jgi:hypothetical protein